MESSQIEAMHLEHTGVAMLPRQVNFWAANFNMKLKTIDDFIAMVKKLAIYRNHKLTLYRKVRAMGSMITEREVSAFLLWLDEHPKLVTERDIELYLIDTNILSVEVNPGDGGDVEQGLLASQTLEQPPQQDVDEIFISEFERAFNRPMYVHEYFKYRVLSCRRPDFDKMFQDQKSKFHRLCELIFTYLDRELGEYEYVKKYMIAADEEPRFFERFLESVLDSKEYEKLMKAKLSDIHQALYDLPIAFDELPFLFRKVKALSLGLDGDYLNQHVVCFKAERDAIVERVIKIYNTILAREPDVHEVNANVLLYRENVRGADQNDGRVDEILSKKLIESYEFHEILKGALRKRHLDLYQTPILPSILYPALESLLCHISNMTTADIDQRVDAALRDKMAC
jgi:hypothetical protein